MECPVDADIDPFKIVIDSTDGRVEISADSSSGNYEVRLNSSDTHVVAYQSFNGDEHADLLTQFGCGNLGDCEYTLYAGCGQNRFIPVLGPNVFYELHPVDPDAEDALSSKYQAYTETESGDRWRQFKELVRSSENPDGRLYSRLYRMYEHLGEYAVVPGSAPPPSEKLKGTPPPSCPAGLHPPVRIEDAEDVVWRGDLNGDDQQDLIRVGERSFGAFETEHPHDVYVHCERDWYTNVFYDGAVTIEVLTEADTTFDDTAWRRLRIVETDARGAEVQAQIDTTSRVVSYGWGEYEESRR